MALEFDGRPFAAGELLGLRAFQVCDDGMLAGPVYPQGFAPGENVAYHLPGGFSLALALQVHQRGEFPHSRLDDPAALASRMPFMRPDHAVGGMQCTCGFYAYYDETADNIFAWGLDRVQGIIRGYGVCTVGTKGFRCEKADLVALVLPDPVKPKLGGYRFALAGAVFAAAACVFDVVAGAPITAAVMALSAVVQALIARRHRRRALAATDPYRATREMYGVPTYPTVAEAIAAHPLTVPEDRPEDTPGSGIHTLSPAATSITVSLQQINQALRAIADAKKPKGDAA